ncbi:DUF4156 domain-containing protein [Cognatilysobacter lacus]|uniref:DUF4156 domain-containing protein n=1 Tax=Cognatilysobacter lacus TaxID=1643323 RepID=A0A5D8ZC38_9GAMM|nr:DUF4156 domain-containing protein [Lysobacter lacus]TZF90234.1 DUF4156 domain-containing protein [Lysobacter lacus]
MSRLFRIGLAVSTLAMAACTWVPMQSGAASVRVLAMNASTAGCTKLGEIEGNVTDRVAVYQRNPLRVQEELETMARNEAVGLTANAVIPVEAPHDGRQRFSALRCAR